ncbi:MAG: septal ring lytic transglycosylase RlpA family protein [Alphaproteobacteria bacterium]|nr:septal ring lytic transglycosylase RlpA family protein [Alphaproteobacteria bacterium]MBE8220095.1 septal ring lytic transglycosylase RlpA family protein [Alphaproteobacteria bacterium]
MRLLPSMRILPMRLLFASALLIPLVLAGCGGSGNRVELSAEAQGRQTASGGIYKIGTPYQIEGQWYYPRENPTYDNIGTASWYGTKFNGKRTANGEIFDMRLLTAAHPTLPMPIMARVTNLENNRSVIVRINDRGPFAKDREIDLSRRAAEVLGFENKGTTQVRVQYLRRAPLYDARGRLVRGTGAETFITEKPTTPRNARRIGAAPIPSVEVATLNAPNTKPTLPTLYTIQVGAFGQRGNAENVRSALRANFPNRVVEIEQAGDFYRVKTGGGNIREDAQAIKEQMIAAGYPNAIVIDNMLQPDKGVSR